jgi:hypothetical protein
MKTSHSCFQRKFKGRLGYELFKKTASLVMPLIKLRKHGSQLNYPKSVTEYWNKKAIKGLILNHLSLDGVKNASKLKSR